MTLYAVMCHLVGYSYDWDPETGLHSSDGEKHDWKKKLQQWTPRSSVCKSQRGLSYHAVIANISELTFSDECRKAP